MMSEEVETIRGYDIPKRELTKEEASRDLTIERIRDFHYKAGEDFLDTADSSNALLFAGFILNKYPEESKEILKIVNEQSNKHQKYNLLEVMNFNYELKAYTYNKEEDIDNIYFDYCEFVNLTGALKARDNQVLIQVTEYYK